MNDDGLLYNMAGLQYSLKREPTRKKSVYCIAHNYTALDTEQIGMDSRWSLNLTSHLAILIQLWTTELGSSFIRLPVIHVNSAWPSLRG